MATLITNMLIQQTPNCFMDQYGGTQLLDRAANSPYNTERY
ncbi:hypothetical protein [Phototrophicus methaneseepsis]|nr:hypothetical protein [Phototrophicus methaneseepsis]